MIPVLREFPAIIKVGFNVSASNEAGVSSTSKKTTGFVWAVRFAKISKGFIDSHLSHETFSNGRPLAWMARQIKVNKMSMRYKAEIVFL